MSCTKCGYPDTPPNDDAFYFRYRQMKPEKKALLRKLAAAIMEDAEITDASRHVFQQLTDIAQSDGPPLIQGWVKIDRLGKALKALDEDSSVKLETKGNENE